MEGMREKYSLINLRRLLTGALGEMEVFREASSSALLAFWVKIINMEFPYVHVCAILSDNRINDWVVKALIMKETQKRDVVDPSGLKEVAAFKRIRFLYLFYFYS